MAPLLQNLTLLLGLVCIIAAQNDPSYSTGNDNTAANDQNKDNVVRWSFRERPPPYAVEKAGNVGVYQCVPEPIIVGTTKLEPVLPNNTHLLQPGVKVIWKVPDHVPHLNQSLAAWQKAKGHGYFVNPENNSLVLVDLAVSDSGLYTCVVQHGQQTLEARMQLHVLYIPPYDFSQRALIGLLAMALMAIFLGAVVGAWKAFNRYRRKRDYRPPHQLTEAEPSLQEV